MTSRRDLGRLDAELDTDFRKHFIESSEMLEILGDESDIIFGSKGVGKTALRRGLMEIHKDQFLGSVNIDLNSVSFQQVHRALSDLRDTSQVDIRRAASSTWLNVLALYALEALAGALEQSNSLRVAIDKFLDQEGLRRKRPNERLLDQIERLFLLLAEFGLESDARSRLWLKPAALDQVNRFPCTEDLRDLLSRCQDTYGAYGKRTLVCLDGFDSIAEHTPEQREVIFTGLVDAVQRSMKNSLLNRSFCFKAFLPLELTDPSEISVWDSDKYALNTHLITWSHSEFERLLARRLHRHARTKSKNFSDLWLDAMPATVHNSEHAVDEPSFDYILRHTQYRPRQVLHHLQRIFDTWDARSDSFRVDASIIPKIVSNTNRELAQFVVGQVAKVNPSISALVQSLRGSSSVMMASGMRQKIRRIFGYQDMADINHALDELFGFGLIGYRKADKLFEDMASQEFHFCFVGDRQIPDLHAAINDDDYLALCPMFVDYCGCSPTECGAIVPVEM